MAMEEVDKKDSRFANGFSIVKVNRPGRRIIVSGSLSGQESKLLECVIEATALIRTAAAVAVRSTRFQVKELAKSLWVRGLINMFDVLGKGDNQVNVQFRLWMFRDAPPPATAQEACRLAILGMFYAYARLEVPEFGWRLIRGRRKPVTAEMVFNGKHGPEKWMIDVPRRGDALIPGADLYIFPTQDEAVLLAPEGKRYMDDLAIFNCSPKGLQKIMRKKPERVLTTEGKY